MLALILTALIAPVANTWTVDDDGPADFTQIADAVAAASPGDVLLVEPGLYDAFNLDKRLSILGRTGPTRPHVVLLSVVSAPGFTLAGLDFEALQVAGVSGRGRIDDCRIGYAGDAYVHHALDVDGCSELVISRTAVFGSHHYSNYYAGGAAARISTSNVALVKCDLKGAKGYDAQDSGEHGGPGGAGLTVADAGRVLVIATPIKGGYEGYGSLFNCVDGPSGDGLEVFTQSLVVLRGAPGASGFVAPGSADDLCGQHYGWCMQIQQGTVITSGVDVDAKNVQLVGGTLIQPAVPEPLLVMDGPDVPGAQKAIELFGPEGATCILVASLSPTYAPLGQFDDKLWVGLSGVYLLATLVTTGQQQPVVLSFQVPTSFSGLEGLVLEMQPFFPGMPSSIEPGKSVAGNVAELIVRF